jgi:hypothetical protein
MAGLHNVGIIIDGEESVNGSIAHGENRGVGLLVPHGCGQPLEDLDGGEDHFPAEAVVPEIGQDGNGQG